MHFHKMMRKLILLFAIQLFLVSILLAPARQVLAEDGGADTGGGNICDERNSAILLDIKGAGLPRSKGLQLRSTPMMDLAGIDRLEDFSGSQLQQWLDLTLQKLEKKSPYTAQVLKQIIGELRFFKTDFTPYRSFRANIDPEICKPEDVRAAAIYKGTGLVFISRPLFNKLDLYSQMGLIIHEALRAAQITLGVGGLNSELQNLTRSILIGTSENLDENPFIQRMRGSQIDGAVSAYDPESLGSMRLLSIASLIEQLRIRYPQEAAKALPREEKAKLRISKEYIRQAIAEPNEKVPEL